MVITRTPLRMSFFGGGTDIKEFYEEYGGSVLATTFDKYCYVTVRHVPPFFYYKNEIVYSKIERVIAENEIEHSLVKNCMKHLDMHDLRVAYDGDLPARAGLATSSCFAVGLLNAFYSIKGKFVDKKKLAEDAIYVEREMCKEAGGIQDQIEVSYGGFNKIDFNKNGFNITPVVIHDDRKNLLNDNLMLFFTGITRQSFVIQENIKKDIKKNTANLKEISKLVNVAYNILTNKNVNLDEFGILLNETWKLKKDISSEISNDFIDNIYKTAMDNGALGGKLLGAGGGGFLLLYVPKEKQLLIKQKLQNLIYVPFKFETEGSQVLYFKPEIYEEGIR